MCGYLASVTTTLTENMFRIVSNDGCHFASSIWTSFYDTKGSVITPCLLHVMPAKIPTHSSAVKIATLSDAATQGEVDLRC